MRTFPLVQSLLKTSSVVGTEQQLWHRGLQGVVLCNDFGRFFRAGFHLAVGHIIGAAMRIHAADLSQLA